MKTEFSVETVQCSMNIHNGVIRGPQYIATTGTGTRLTEKGSTLNYSKSQPHSDALDDILASFFSLSRNEISQDAIMEIVNCLPGSLLDYSISIAFSYCSKIYNRDRAIVQAESKTITINLMAITMMSGQPVRISREYHNTLDRAEPLVDVLSRVIEVICRDYEQAVFLPFKAIPERIHTIITPPGRGGLIIHETIGHMMEADNFFEGDNALRKCMGKSLCLRDISVIDSPDECLSAEVSDDGTRKEQCEIIRDGKLCHVLSDEYYSSLYACKDTGNGRSERYDRLPIPRMHKTYLRSKLNKKVDISSISNGVAINDIQGGSCDVETGSFSFNIAHAYLIQNGDKVAQLAPFTMIAQTADFFNALIEAGNDLDLYSSLCGKKGQLLRVIYGAPTMVIDNEKLGGSFGG